MIKNCVICNKEFETNSNRQVTCCETCRKIYRCKYQKEKRKGAMQTRKCEVCGKIYETTYSKKKTCGAECSKELHRRRKKERKVTEKEEMETRISNTKLIEDDVRKAKELGISYGMYKALSL